MRVVDLLNASRPSFSFEFFPPKTEERLARLFSTIEHLAELQPTFVSVTYGAGGETRGQTVEIARRIKQDTGIEPVAHLTCMGQTRDDLARTLDNLANAGIENVLALRGDPPKENTGPSEFHYANELIAFVRTRGPFCIGAACYPEGHSENPDREDDLRRLVDKVSAGVDFLVTQLFFDNSHYFSFLKEIRSRGVSVPVLPGIMPVTNSAQVKRFTTMCGASLPGQLTGKLERLGEDEQAVTAIGIEWAIRQGRELLTLGSPGVHFYTLNRSLATRVVCVSLGGVL